MWKAGSLHLLVSAPRAAYAHRMTITPESSSAGDFVAVMLPWCGDKLYAHEALRKAAANVDLGIMGQLFIVDPTSLDPDSTAQSNTLTP